MGNGEFREPTDIPCDVLAAFVSSCYESKENPAFFELKRGALV